MGLGEQGRAAQENSVNLGQNSGVPIASLAFSLSLPPPPFLLLPPVTHGSELIELYVLSTEPGTLLRKT